ncbi:MAG: hypothetical protein EBU46_09765 [Nitrosomonadaceae bacterium]|nr:hypothetical protein [Nitrosomonadaceae bacterium]
MKNVEKLLEDHKRMIENEVNIQSKYVPRSVVQAEAYKLARKAAESFDEKSGLKFSTHLTNQLKKLSRISTQFGASVRIPENKQFRLQLLNRVQSHLESELRREPTLSELAEASGMPIAEVSNLLSNRKYETAFSNVVYQPVFIDNGNDEWLHLVYHDLSDIDRLIFEHKTGFGGKKVLNNEEIAELVKLSPSTVANRIKMITDRIQEGWQQ